MKKTNKMLLGAAVAALLASGCASTESTSTEAKGECHGINACKGTGACGGPGYSCAGNNECKGKGWLSLTEKECTEKGGQFKM